MGIGVKLHPHFHEIYEITLDSSKKLATKNLTPGKKVYGEKVFKIKGSEYRLWDPYRSKLAAAILNNLKEVPLRKNQKVLYLGAASGTTASHVSDIVGIRGHVYCVEFSSRTIRELVNNVCIFRTNMTPIYDDARIPEKYSIFVEQVDGIYCDIAQHEQAKILADNADLFLKKGGWSILAIKSQSIDVTKDPEEIYEQELAILETRGFETKDVVRLEPFDKAHAMAVSIFPL